MSDFDSELPQRGFGWHPDLPDRRDFGLHTEQVAQLVQQLRMPAGAQRKLPSHIDWREFFPPVTDQRERHASSAHSCVSLVEYFQRRACGDLQRGSSRFVHDMSQKLLRRSGDSGSDLRTTLKTILRFGIPPVEYYPDYSGGEADGAFLLRMTQNIPLVYFRVAPRGSTETLDSIKTLLAAGIPCVFGFSIPSSLSADSDVPWRPYHDYVRGGQAVVAVGYDDTRIRSTKGALIIRSSWGPLWGEQGYGYLPYRYVEEELASDFWSVLSDRWMASTEFGLLQADR